MLGIFFIKSGVIIVLAFIKLKITRGLIRILIKCKKRITLYLTNNCYKISLIFIIYPKFMEPRTHYLLYIYAILSIRSE